MRHHTMRLAVPLGTAALILSACSGVETTTGGGDETAQDYPTGSVEMLVGASAGGSSDLISRAVSQGLSESLGQSFPVINREGANGAIAAAELASAEPDGSTIAIQNASLFAITPLAVSEDEVTSIEDFDVVHGISRDDYVMVAPAGGPYSTLDAVKGATSTVTYGTTGVGTGAQVSCALLLGSAGVQGEAVPFDGGAPALTAVLGGQVDTACLQVGEAIENIESGKLAPLAVFGPERIEYLPDVPTAQEQGLDVEVAQYRFLTVPKGTPDAVKDALVQGLQDTFESEEYQSFNEQNSLTPMEIPGDEVVAQLEEDKQRYADLVEEYGIDLGGEG
ncbi:Bug family tripartite tricarboxylate transporter substrate binding protein [Cellulosimicrobium cellulans]|uniref:Bug family tripartite tricarboxylate transporter substrate binding protein n=1 Tax=Cellulosimicrobium cellulans TaxID=1710 RepID=UPI000848B9F1|nr:tripartite tricarboxylate transporter substrate binding protein [Cellulosimicrobium cellulans]